MNETHDQAAADVACVALNQMDALRNRVAVLEAALRALLQLSDYVTAVEYAAVRSHAVTVLGAAHHDKKGDSE